MNQLFVKTILSRRISRLAQRAAGALDVGLHVEALGGVLLLAATAAALLFANSPWALWYGSLWHLPIGAQVGSFAFVRSLHFWVNDGLMTLFFLGVGLEIRREIHAGSLSHTKQATLPIAAAIGGVLVPASLYLAVNRHLPTRHGWAIPTATDIAFATALLALLGHTIPSKLRIFLLMLAIVDDIIAVLVIAAFYSNGLQYGGFVVAGVGLLLIWAMQRCGIATAIYYAAPGTIIWGGLLLTGIHPALSGVALGLVTPMSFPRKQPHTATLPALDKAQAHKSQANGVGIEATGPHGESRVGSTPQLMPSPAVRVLNVIHPWISYLIMPLFAFANAGISLGGPPLGSTQTQHILIGICVALVLGKPLGVIGITWLMVRLRWCQLPTGIGWGGITLVGLLAGVGFTMSTFIALLAFADHKHVEAAKLGILLASLMASSLGIGWGLVYRHRLRGRS